MDEHIIKSRTIFFIAQHDKYIADDVISIVTALKPWNWGTPNVCHAEKWLPDFAGRFIDDGGDYLGTCFTSTMRGESNGTIFKPAGEVLKHPGRWLCCEASHLTQDYYTARGWARAQVRDNLGYAFRDIPRQIGIPFIRDDDRNICTEATQNFDVLSGVFKKMRCPDPRELLRLYEKAGLTIKPLIEMDR